MGRMTRAVAAKAEPGGQIRKRANPSSADNSNLATLSSAPVEDIRSLEKALGHQIRALRQERDLSSADLGHASGISLGMISKIENGQISPSLSTINAIATALNVPFSSLFLASEEKRDCSYVRSGHGLTIERGGTKVGHAYALLGAALRGDIVIEPYLITLREDAGAYSGFQHPGTEFIYMLTGELIYRHANQDYHLTPGDSLMFDSKGLHGPVKLIQPPITYVAVIAYPRSK